MAINVFRKGGGIGGSKETKSDLFNSYLRSEGYQTEVDSDGDILFKAEGLSYYLLAQEDDREFFSLVFPNFWPIESEAERAIVYIAACHATANTKVASVYPMGDTVMASVQSFFEEPEQFKPVFRRSLGSIQTAVASFVEKMRELT